MSIEDEVLAAAAMIVNDEADRIESARIDRARKMNETIMRRLLGKAGINVDVNMDDLEAL